MGANKLQAIRYERGRLQLLDQRLLPFETVYLDTPTPQAAWTQIRDMVVRGAPAIGVTGALSMAVDLTTNKGGGSAFASVAEALEYINTTLDYLVTSRPTAVNLADGCNKLKAVAASAAAASGATPKSIVDAIVASAEAYFAEDLAANKAMGAYGAKALLDEASARGKGLGGRLRVLTHCNTGSLATAGFGTALGVIRALHEQGALEHAFCTETRPYNQGARLTAFELVHDGLPATLICDLAAASLMAAGQVDAVVVGADRVVANGDTANKIGTYMLSIVAAHHNIPFFIAAPTTTLDANTPDGSQIVIEQRPPEEVTHFKGQRVVVEGIKVYNPCFDVAPAALIAGIITEKGLVPKKDAKFQVREFMSKLGLWSPPSHHFDATHGGGHLEGFKVLDHDIVKDYIVSMPTLQQMVGPPESAPGWSVEEVGDGNINFVYIVKGPSGALCVKQALPFVRCVGESWPLSQERVRIEAQALMEEERHARSHVPHVFHFDLSNSIIVMKYLAPPFGILRHGIVAGRIYPLLAEHMAEFLATTLFHTSALKLDTATFRKQVAKFTNCEMCRLTEQVVFTDPYFAAPHNRHTSPHLDADALALRVDPEAKSAISELKEKFVHTSEALLHADLHTGSVMVTETETYVIDPEFAYVGPMAFDVGKFISNIIIALFASYGHEKVAGERQAQRDWLGDCIVEIWTKFEAKFLALWGRAGQGELLPATLVGPDAPNGPACLEVCQRAYMDRMWRDTVAFAGACLVRRIVGIAHCADFDKIPDIDVRAGCERRALRFGRQLLVHPETFAEISTLASACRTAANPNA